MNDAALSEHRRALRRLDSTQLHDALVAVLHEADEEGLDVEAITNDALETWARTDREPLEDEL